MLPGDISLCKQWPLIHGLLFSTLERLVTAGKALIDTESHRVVSKYTVFAGNQLGISFRAVNVRLGLSRSAKIISTGTR